MDKNIRQQIEDQMKVLGLSNADLARRLEISPQAVGQIINGKRGSIPDSLDTLLKALDLELIAKPKGSK